MSDRDLRERIIFEDTHLVVFSKPAGLLSQEDHTGEPDLVTWLRQYFGRNYVGLIHRLDRNTSGLMVVAKRTKAANRLTEALQNGKLRRTYQAWVHGHLEAKTRWKHFLQKNEKTNVVSVVPEGKPGAKIAILSVRPLSKGKWKNHDLTLVELELETGRSHQIRVQSAAEGHPLLGDRKYGHAGGDDFPRPALHSNHLEFPHPMSGELLTFDDPLPEDLRRIQPFK